MTDRAKRFKKLMGEAASLNGYLLQNIPAEVYEDALEMGPMGDDELKAYIAWRVRKRSREVEAAQPSTLNQQAAS